MKKGRPLDEQDDFYYEVDRKNMLSGFSYLDHPSDEASIIEYLNRRYRNVKRKVPRIVEEKETKPPEKPKKKRSKFLSWVMRRG